MYKNWEENNSFFNSFSFFLRPKIFSRKWSSKIKRIYNFIFEYIYLNFCPLWLWLMNLRWWPKLYNDMTILIRIIQFRKLVRSTNIEQFPKSCYFCTYLYLSKITIGNSLPLLAWFLSFSVVTGTSLLVAYSNMLLH